MIFKNLTRRCAEIHDKNEKAWVSLHALVAFFCALNWSPDDHWLIQGCLAVMAILLVINFLAAILPKPEELHTQPQEPKG